MARLIQAARLDEAAEDLRRWEHRLTEVGGRLEHGVERMRWEGRGADRFRSQARERRAELRRITEQLGQAAAALRRAADEVRDEARDLARIERAYGDLAAAGVIKAAGRTPPPSGDTSWREYFQHVIGEIGEIGGVA
jgi:uncharacterized protein YukE